MFNYYNSDGEVLRRSVRKGKIQGLFFAMN